jgi:hypothetical protein
MALASLVSLNVQATQDSTLDLGKAAFNASKTYSVSYQNGVAAGQANKLFTDTRTVAASSNDDLDLNGVLTDAFGGSLALLRVKGLIVAAAAGNTNDVVVGGAASNAWVAPFGASTHTLKVKPGAVLALFAGLTDATAWPVIAATGDVLRIANGGAGTPVTYDVVIIGADA